MKQLTDKKKLWSPAALVDSFLQHNELKILTGSSEDLAALHKDVYKKFQIPHKSDRYFFVFNEQDPAKHSLDLLEINLSGGELLFVVPNQIHTSPPLKKGLKFHSLSFEANCLSLLPRQFYFLTNPFNRQIISFDNESRQRVKTLFETLRLLLFPPAQGTIQKLYWPISIHYCPNSTTLISKTQHLKYFPVINFQNIFSSNFLLKTNSKNNHL